MPTPLEELATTDAEVRELLALREQLPYRRQTLSHWPVGALTSREQAWEGDAWHGSGFWKSRIVPVDDVEVFLQRGEELAREIGRDAGRRAAHADLDTRELREAATRVRSWAEELAQEPNYLLRPVGPARAPESPQPRRWYDKALGMWPRHVDEALAGIREALETMGTHADAAQQQAPERAAAWLTSIWPTWAEAPEWTRPSAAGHPGLAEVLKAGFVQGYADRAAACARECRALAGATHTLHPNWGATDYSVADSRWALAGSRQSYEAPLLNRYRLVHINGWSRQTWSPRQAASLLADLMTNRVPGAPGGRPASPKPDDELREHLAGAPVVDRYVKSGGTPKLREKLAAARAARTPVDATASGQVVEAPEPAHRPERRGTRATSAQRPPV